MKTQLKDNIFIEGFDDGIAMHHFKVKNKVSSIYCGKTSEIPEDVAKKCVASSIKGLTSEMTYRDYRFEEWEECFDITESIQSACNQPYCIIYKEK